MLDKNLQQRVINTLQKEIKELKLITLFGSIVTPYFQQNKSDIDIAFLATQKIDNLQCWEIQEKLASQLNSDIDLVDLNNSNDVLRFEVISTGKDIFIEPSMQLEHTLDSFFYNYIQLNEDRAEIIELYQ